MKSRQSKKTLYKAQLSAKERTTSVSNAPSSTYDPTLPICIILEPSRELALQTDKCINDFSKYVASPGVNSVCLVGGEDSRHQLALLQEGVDIVKDFSYFTKV